MNLFDSLVYENSNLIIIESSIRGEGTLIYEYKMKKDNSHGNRRQKDLQDIAEDV